VQLYFIDAPATTIWLVVSNEKLLLAEPMERILSTMELIRHKNIRIFPAIGI